MMAAITGNFRFPIQATHGYLSLEHFYAIDFRLGPDAKVRGASGDRHHIVFHVGVPDLPQ
jgi:hypothetical protein